ncbi:MAG TPA: cytochrome c oxidase assembly protein [Alphaproteobacteria bacterium]|jgi:cytochrome c oxidase assembly protein subunit 11|nr:cytochrome c oxidase assembly protein [Alphaproteobacteria bacterium]
MQQTDTGQHLTPAAKRVAFSCIVAVAAMLGLSYASVPLYRIFCSLTGYGGATATAESAPDQVIDRLVTIRFDANVAQGLNWRFVPDQASQQLKIGEVGLAFYRARNLSDRPVTGTASFNVTPAKAGEYFTKIECFCFTEQSLAPGQEMDMPVQYFVDPAIADDINAGDIKTITLSYTFHQTPSKVSETSNSSQRN